LVGVHRSVSVCLIRQKVEGWDYYRDVGFIPNFFE
jgi:hypothetical protein